jgi:hypothetical protein
MKDVLGLVFHLFHSLMVDGPPQFAVIPVTLFFVAPAGGLFWLFAVDAFRRLRYSISENESAGPRPFVLSLFGLSFALGAFSYLQTVGWALGTDSYSRTRGIDGGAAIGIVAFILPGLGLVLVFMVGMALSGGADPPLSEWLDRWRPTRKSRKKKTQETHVGWAWFRMIIWVPCVAMAVSIAGIAAAALGRVFVRIFVDLYNA